METQGFPRGTENIFGSKQKVGLLVLAVLVYIGGFAQQTPMT